MKKIFLFYLIFGYLKSAACSCSDIPKLKESVEHADLIATVELIDFHSFIEEYEHDGGYYRLKVLEVFSGYQFDTIIVFDFGSSCNFGFSKKNEEYLVFANHIKAPQNGEYFGVHSCSGTTLKSNFNDRLEELMDIIKENNNSEIDLVDIEESNSQEKLPQYNLLVILSEFLIILALLIILIKKKVLSKRTD